MGKLYQHILYINHRKEGLIVKLKYPYKIEIYKKFDDVRLEFENEQTPPNNELISLFLGSDVQPSIGSVKDMIEELDSYQVIIEELFPNDEDNPVQCTVETIELRKLMLIWYREVVEYTYEQGRIDAEKRENILKWTKEQEYIGTILEQK